MSNRYEKSLEVHWRIGQAFRSGFENEPAVPDPSADVPEFDPVVSIEYFSGVVVDVSAESPEWPTSTWGAVQV